jgi:hypothetical protein
MFPFTVEEEPKSTPPFKSILLNVDEPLTVLLPENITFPSLAVKVPLLVKFPFDEIVSSLELLASEIKVPPDWISI